MLDKAKLGTRYVCFKCETKFYDLNRPDPLCPECQADQRTAPTKDVKSLLQRGKGRGRDGEEEVGFEEEDEESILEEDDDDDVEGGDDEEEAEGGEEEEW